MTSVLDHQIVGDLRELLACDAPQQFVSRALIGPVQRLCTRLALPLPQQIAGNLVVGDLDTAAFVLSAHLDEASFSVTTILPSQITLAACHRLPAGFDRADISMIGVRDTQAISLGQAELRMVEGLLIADTCGDIRLGDRAVYHRPATAEGDLLTSKAIDDRVGTVIALHAAQRLTRAGLPVAVVLSDGEQNRPETYFSRTFPHLLHRLHPEARIIFVDGIFHDGLLREGIHGAQPGALVVPHSGDGAGYSVEPDLYALLRDLLVPAAVAVGIDVRVSGAYHSRGDDWGLVTNPRGVEHDAFFVSFGGWGPTPAVRTIDLACLGNCVDFIAFAAEHLS